MTDLCPVQGHVLLGHVVPSTFTMGVTQEPYVDQPRHKKVASHKSYAFLKSTTHTHTHTDEVEWPPPNLCMSNRRLKKQSSGSLLMPVQ